MIGTIGLLVLCGDKCVIWFCVYGIFIFFYTYINVTFNCVY